MLELEITRRMHAWPATPIHLSRIVLGLAKLKWAPKWEFVQALLRNVLVQATNANVQHLCNLLWGLSELQGVHLVTNHHSPSRGTPKRREGAGPEDEQRTVGGGVSRDDSGNNRDGGGEVDDAHSTMLSTTSRSVPVGWMDAVCAQLAISLDDLVVEDLRQLSIAFARLGYRPDNGFLRALQVMTLHRLSDLDARSLIIYVFAMHQIDYRRLHEDIWRALEDKIIGDDGQQLWSHHVAMALRAYGNGRITPSIEVMQVLEGRLEAAWAGSAGLPREEAIRGMVRLRYVPRRTTLKTAFYAELQRHVTECEKRGVDPFGEEAYDDGGKEPAGYDDHDGCEEEEKVEEEEEEEEDFGVGERPGGEEDRDGEDHAVAVSWGSQTDLDLEVEVEKGVSAEGGADDTWRLEEAPHPRTRR